MHQRVRKFIFLLFFSVFLVGAPMLVLYTAGYRLNFTTFRVQQTGVIAISSAPRGATVFLDGIDTEAKTPYVIQRLSPGSYTVTLTKEGYISWEQRVEVASGATTYITATLFADAQPELLFETPAIDVSGDTSGRFIDVLLPFDEHTLTQSILRYDTVTHITQPFAALTPEPTTPYWFISRNADDTTLIVTGEGKTIGVDATTGSFLDADALALAMDPLPGYTFTDNGTNTEFRDAKTHTLLSLLPPGPYAVTYTDKLRTMFADSRGRTYLFTPTNGAVAQITLPTAIVDTNSDGSLLVGSDGNEIDVFDTTTGATTLLARQSEMIIGLDWHTDDHTVICTTQKSIFAVAQEKHETREVTMLVGEADIIDTWLDTTGKHLTFFGTIDGVTGIWSLALTQ